MRRIIIRHPNLEKARICCFDTAAVGAARSAHVAGLHRCNRTCALEGAWKTRGVYLRSAMKIWCITSTLRAAVRIGLAAKYAAANVPK